MIDSPHRLRQRITLDSWAAAIVIAFVALIVLGILPRVSWRASA